MAVDLMSHWLARVARSPVGGNVVGVDSTLWFDLLAFFTLLAVVIHGWIFKVRRVVVLCHPRFLSPRPNRIVLRPLARTQKRRLQSVLSVVRPSAVSLTRSSSRSTRRSISSLDESSGSTTRSPWLDSRSVVSAHNYPLLTRSCWPPSRSSPD